jgi:hypothetical protein
MGGSGSGRWGSSRLLAEALDRLDLADCPAGVIGDLPGMIARIVQSQDRAAADYAARSVLKVGFYKPKGMLWRTFNRLC